MANEISESLQFSVANGDHNPGQINYSKQIDQSASGSIEGVWKVGTSVEALSMGDVTTPGRSYFRNLDSTNFVTFGTTTTQHFIRLNAGESQIVRLATTSCYGQADTAEVKVQYRILEN